MLYWGWDKLVTGTSMLDTCVWRMSSTFLRKGEEGEFWNVWRSGNLEKVAPSSLDIWNAKPTDDEHTLRCASIYYNWNESARHDMHKIALFFRHKTHHTTSISSLAPRSSQQDLKIAIEIALHLPGTGNKIASRPITVLLKKRTNLRVPKNRKLF